ncbi:MAG: G-D-S-L family lipolytic protein [Flavobacteriales bacterium CG_4_9_14_3_um_filter_40_17]|nr:MAG: G-D-S-L family lipolytic protein [Flavobacteriales bacterium CG_4_9_14_3_um_filter_40_17]
MKTFSIAITAVILLIMTSSFTSKPPKKIIFFGDSITEMGVQKGGYIDLIQQKLIENNQAEQYELVGAGIGGNKIYDLYFRLEKDVLELHPDVVFIFVGVNDVWHKDDFGTGTDPDRFDKFYTAIIEKIKGQGAEVICVTPAAIGEKSDFSNPQDGDLNEYSKIVRQIASNTNSQLIDLRKIFLDYNLTNNPENLDRGILTTDRVHLNQTGNELVAELFLQAFISK